MNMSKRNIKKNLLLVILITTLIGLGVLAVSRQKNRLTSEGQAAATPVTIDSRLLTRGTITLTMPMAAEVQALQEANIASRLTGFVTALRFTEGDHFKKGDLLVQLDTADAQSVVQRAQADLARTQLQQGTLNADLAAANVANEAANDRLTRAKSLYSIKGISLEQLQTEQSNQAASQARLAGTQAAVGAYRASLSSALAVVQSARANLAYAEIRAPFDGMVAARPLQVGDLATPGKVLLRLVGLNEQRLLVNLPVDVEPQALLWNRLELPLKPWPEATPQGMRRFEARATGLIPGTRASVQILTFKADGVLLPDACLLGNDGRTATVFQLPEDGPAKPMLVALQATGSEGSVSVDEALSGQMIACGGADVLTRLALGVPFQLAKGH